MSSIAHIQQAGFARLSISEALPDAELESDGSFATALRAGAGKYGLDATEAIHFGPSKAAKTKFPQPLGIRLLSRAWAWLRKNRAFGAEKQLRVSDTVSLGEKRFVALLHVEGRKFLIGGGSSGVSLLARLEPVQGEKDEPQQTREGEEQWR